MQAMLDIDKIKDIVKLAIEEDVGKGDITSELFVPEGSISEGAFIAKEEGVIAGFPVAEYVFSQIDGNLAFTSYVKEGTSVNKGTVIADIKGFTMSILSAERLVLNFMQRLSGIATITNRFVERVKGCEARIMDTRKTTPGWRYLEKYAVKVGGGHNHRIGLYDQILVKDNHLKIMGIDKGNKGVFNELVKKAKKQTGNMLVEVEIEDIYFVKDMLDAGVDIILFDNMEPSKISEAVGMIREYKKAGKTEMGKQTLTEVSGNITLENVEAYAKTGVDRISIGAITHSAMALDISLEIV